MRAYPQAFNHYKRIVWLLSLAIFIGALVQCSSSLDDSWEPAIFFLLIFVAELLPVRFPGTISEVAMTMPALVSLFLSHGTAPMIVISSVGMFAASIVAHYKNYPIRRLIDMASYNIAIHIIVAVAASLAFILAGGTTLGGNPNITLSQMILPLLLWVFAFTTINVFIYTTGLSLYTCESWRMLVVQHLGWTIPNYFITAPSGILFACLYMKYGVFGILLVIVPFLMGRQALNQYALQLATYRETITTLGSYMQHYHPYTKGHLERVANLADMIAKQMGLSLQSLMFIRDAGLLHDVGKVGVSEEILDKVGPLSDEDWVLIKQHPARGAEILSHMKYLDCIVPWVRGHHERPDGKGYPDGLKSNDTPIEAAVISAADAFDAMTGGNDEREKRTYRPPLALDQAVAQMRYGAGTQFDPRVIKAFLHVMAGEETESGR